MVRKEEIESKGEEKSKYNNGEETNNGNEPATSTKIICFLFPIIAFVIYAVNVRERKKYADKCLMFGLLHIPIIIVATIIIVGALQGTSGTLTKSSNSSSYSNSPYSSDTSSSKLLFCKY